VGKATEAITRLLVQSAQYTPFRGTGGYSSQAFAAKGESNPYPQAAREARYFDDFFYFFQERLTRQMLADQTVLDFGCGYGGRTVEYAVQGHARKVIGVEPVLAHINLARRYAAARKVFNVQFELCTQAEIPLPSASIDIVLSYDVLEHVSDPRQSLREIERVLRPGGKAFLVFPVYDGALSHHLDYIVRVPGLHWIFEPSTLINAINSVLADDEDLSRFGTRPQPQPGLSFDGQRRVLPTLNGMTGDDFQDFARAFEVEYLHFRPLLARRKVLGAVFRALMRRRLPGRLRDAITSNVVCILHKRPDQVLP
jgi:SAM-dependent methyltransferase